MITWLLAVGLWLISGSGEALASTGTSDALAGPDGSQVAAVGMVESAGSADFVAESYAQDYSVTVEEAGRRLNRIGLLQEAMGSIRALEGSRVAGWGINHGEDFGAWVWLVDDEQPSDEAARIATAHDDVEIRVGATHTHEELQAAQDRIDPKLIGDDPETSSKIAAMVVYTGIDMAANSVTVGIDPDLGSGSGSGRSRRDATPEQESDPEGFAAEAAVFGAALGEHTGVEMVMTDASGFSNTAEFRGGEAMYCTAGFTAKQTGGPYGILTAGHCPDFQTMHRVSLPFVVGRKGTRADAQFHRIPHYFSHRMTNDYVCGANANSVCEVTGTAKRTDMMGSYVCLTGRKTGVSCGEITDVSMNPTRWWINRATTCLDEDGKGAQCKPVFVRVEGTSLKGCVGDSGGPFYDADGIAYGILKGTTKGLECNYKGKKSAVFSVVEEIEDLLDVKVLTEPPRPPSAPQDLMGSLRIKTRVGIRLTWNEPAEGAFSYHVYRRVSRSGGDFKLIATTYTPFYLDLPFYLDPQSGLLSGFNYEYKVQAVNNLYLRSKFSHTIEVSGFSVKELRAQVNWKGPSNQRGTSISWQLSSLPQSAHASDTNPSISRTDNHNAKITNFRVYRRSIGSGDAYQQIGESRCCDYLDPISGLRPGIKYLYRVRPVNQHGLEGSWGSKSDYAAVRAPTAKPKARVADPGTTLNGRLFRGVVVSWNEVEADVASYEVYRRAAVSGQPYERIATTGETEYYDPLTGLTPGMEYYYRVKIVGNDGAVGHWGSKSNYAAVRLPALTGLQAAVSSDSGSVTFTWAKPAGDVVRYDVYRRAAIRGQPYTKVGDTTTASYSDPLTGLVSGAEYYYRVKAVSAAEAVGSWGPGSNYVWVVAPAVGSLKATAVASGVSVTWQQPTGDVARYKVYRRVAVQGQAYAEIAETEAAPYLDQSTGLTPGTEYYYRVKPVGTNGVVGGWGPGPNYASIKYRY